MGNRSSRRRSTLIKYQPQQGDIVWVNLEPQAGHEQKGRRPALVISNNTFNNFTRKMAMVLPITNTNKNLPIHIQLNEKTKTTGVILCDQAKVLDLEKRDAEFIEKVPKSILLEAVDIVYGIIEIEE